MTIRELKTGDTAEVVALWRYAFGAVSDAEPTEAERARYLSNYGIGAFENETLASALLVHPLDQAVRGRILPMGGIGGVATFPEQRGRGHVRQLMLSTFEAMRERGQVVSMLAPFKESFYGRFGYVSAQPEVRLTTSLDGLVQWLSREVYPSNYETTRVPAIRVRERYCRAVGSMLKQYHGRAFRSDVGESEWKSRVSNREAVILSRDGEDVALFQLEKKKHEGWYSRLAITGLYSADDRAHEAVLGFLACHRDQIHLVDIDVGADVPAWRWFADGSEDVTLRGGKPWMVRIVDVVGALDGTKVGRPDGRLRVRVDDAQCAWNSRIYSFEASGGTLSVRVVDGEEADAVLSIEQLSALLYGVRPAFRYRRTPDGRIDAATHSLLTGWFSSKVVRNDWYF